MWTDIVREELSVVHVLFWKMKKALKLYVQKLLLQPESPIPKRKQM